MSQTSSRSFPSFWALHLCGWAALGLSMWIGVLTHVDDPGRAFVGKMIFAITGGTLTLGLRPLYCRLHERRVSMPTLIIVSAVCSYGLTVVWSILHRGSVNMLWQWVDGEALTLLPFAWLISGTLFYTFIPMAWSVLYFGVKYYQDVHAERERALAAEGQAHWARLQALRYQINPHFLFNTLNAISTLVAKQDAGQFEDRLAGLLAALGEEDSTPKDDSTDRFAVKTGGHVRFVKAEEIQWVEAAGNYVKLHTDATKHLLRQTMKEMEVALDDDQFLRIHRSTIVNVDTLQEMRPCGTNNEYTVILKDGTKRRLSRTYREQADRFFNGAL